MGAILGSYTEGTASGPVKRVKGVAVLNDDGTKGSSSTNPNSNPATIYSAQQTVTASAVALAARAGANGFVIKALAANTGTTYVGPSGVTVATGYPLAPGEAISYEVSNASAIFIIGTVADKVAVTGN